MPRFYFHLSSPGEDFPDNIGSDVRDVVDAHSRAVLLAKRMTMVSRLADYAPDFRRWAVNVADERQRPVFTVIFPTNSAPRDAVGGARALLARLAGRMEIASNPEHTHRMAASATRHVGRALARPRAKHLLNF
jgi:hypothetical protein